MCDNQRCTEISKQLIHKVWIQSATNGQYHKQGERTDLHYRTVWVGLLSKDRDRERKFIVDIPATAFNLLPEVPQIKYLETKEWTKWWV